MFRRPLGRPVRPAMQANVPPALQKANQLMSTGQYEAAAEVFERFAEGAVARNGPRAPWVLLRAGQARLLAGQVLAALAHFRHGLSLLATKGQLQQFAGAGNRIVLELKARGLSAQATEIEDYLKSTLSAGFASVPPAATSEKKKLLPTACPGCGGPLRSDEAEWVDEVTAECPYCGSQVRVE